MSTHNLPSGKIHLDETIAEAAAREFSEKVTQGVTLQALEHFGVSHITIKQDDYVISDYIALLMRGTISVTGSLGDGSKLCTTKDTEKLNLMPSVSELLRAYQDSSIFSEHTVFA